MSESFEKLLDESLSTVEMKQNSIVTGTVVDIEQEWVVVHAGLKSEGLISKGQFLDENGNFDLNIGDQVKVVMEQIDDGWGTTHLSRERAKHLEAWESLEVAYQNGDIVVGKVTGKVKGGFTVDVNDVRAFLPGSLVDVRPVRDPSHIQNTSIELKVIKLDYKRSNVVVSRKAVLQEDDNSEREKFLSTLEEGMEVKGIVKNLTDYGAFVDLGGIDGLLHITDMAWKRVRHPSEVLEVGVTITVKVLKFDRERTRVSLGLKQLGEDPWVNVVERYPKNTKVMARVTNLTDYGCFAEIEEGVEGLVHVSEMDWTNKNVHPSKVVRENDEIEVMIIDVDQERRRISLGIKQCRVNPWDDFAKKYNRNDRVKGKVKSITDFGMFIGLEGDIDGLIHLSDLAWEENGEGIVRRYSKGEEVETVVLSVDAERERISLGIKQLNEDHFSLYLKQNERGTIVQGEVSEVRTKEAVVTLSEGVVGTLKASEIKEGHVTDARTELVAGSKVTVKIVGVDRKNRSIALSIRQKDRDEEHAAVLEHRRQEEATAKEESASSSLGALIKAQIDEQSANLASKEDEDDEEATSQQKEDDADSSQEDDSKNDNDEPSDDPKK